MLILPQTRTPYKTLTMPVQGLRVYNRRTAGQKVIRLVPPLLLTRTRTCEALSNDLTFDFCCGGNPRMQERRVRKISALALACFLPQRPQVFGMSRSDLAPAFRHGISVA